MILELDRNRTAGGASDLIFRRLYARTFSHTIGRASRTCESCHNDPVALGYGRGILRYSIAGGRGRWTFTPAHERSAADGLPTDAWTGFLQARGGMVSTRDDVRPFTVDEQRRILGAGACLTCHAGTSAVMQPAITDFDATVARRSRRCVAGPSLRSRRNQVPKILICRFLLDVGGGVVSRGRSPSAPAPALRPAARWGTGRSSPGPEHVSRRSSRNASGGGGQPRPPWAPVPRAGLGVLLDVGDERPPADRPPQERPECAGGVSTMATDATSPGSRFTITAAPGASPAPPNGLPGGTSERPRAPPASSMPPPRPPRTPPVPRRRPNRAVTRGLSPMSVSRRKVTTGPSLNSSATSAKRGMSQANRYAKLGLPAYPAVKKIRRP